MAADLGLVYLIDDEPTLLPLVERPFEEWPVAISHRVQHERYTCLGCGSVAMVAYIVGTKQGPRWLDLCPPCARELRAALEEEAAKHGHSWGHPL